MNTINKKTEKIKKLSKNLHILTNIGGVMIVMVMAALVVFIINPPEDISRITIDSIGGAFPVEGSAADLRIYFSTALITCLFLAITLFITGRIFWDISRDCSPFSMKHVKKLKLIAKLLVILTLLKPICRAVSTLLFSSWGGESEMMLISFDIGTLVFAAVLYCLALIFEYGAELQQQADETL